MAETYKTMKKQEVQIQSSTNEVKCGDYDTFMEVCHNLHADEEDPELMYYPKSEVIKSSDWFVSDSQHNILATLFLTFHNIPISLGFSTNS